MSTPIQTASQLGIARCHACGNLCQLGGEVHRSAHCPTCHSKVHLRKPHSIALTWLYTLAATLLYIPANILPMMTTRSIVGVESDTIFSGIVYFWTSGSAGLGIIVFVASIAVPSIKLLILYYLLISTMQGHTALRMQRTRLYRFLEIIGRWSMLDIFVVAITVALVNFPGTAEITAGPGAVAFGAVVVLTLLASESFDPRLIWDAASASHSPSVEQTP